MEQKQKILIIEDDNLMVNLYSNTFQLNGFDVAVAKDGIEGIALLKNAKDMPAAILLDIMMPKMNGFEVLKKLKEESRTKDVPVIVLSNLAQPDDVEKVMKLGASSYLVKSQNDPDDTVKKVRQVIAEPAR
jgi:two-component system, response regulator